MLSDERWLDVHSAACAPEYREFVRQAGFERGWSVLDIGSGSGSFIPWLREAVGPEGRIVCLDMAIENCYRSAAKLGTGDVAVATLVELPFATGSFDAVWTSNTAQYLTDAQLASALQYQRRIIRPGGRMAIKDVDMLVFKASPADPFLFSHLAEACFRAPDAPPESAGSLRGRDLRRLLEGAGFVAVEQHSVLIERWAPLTPAESELWAGWLSYLAALAMQRDIPAADIPEWQSIAKDGGVPFVSQADFYGCEVQVLAVGVVPGGAA